MQLAARRYDPVSTDNKTPVIILHGLFGSSRNWHPIARSLAETALVYALDLRNHGKSPHSDSMTYPEMAGDIAEFMDQQQLPEARFIAHSMGGKVAMWLALTEPQRVQKLVVVDIAPVNYKHDFSTVLNAMQAVPLKQISSRTEADQFLAEYLPQADLRHFLLQNLQLKEGHYQWRLNLEVIRKSISDISGFPDTGKVTPFEKRVLFVAGAQSDYLRQEYRAQTRQLFPLASFSSIKNAGHWLHSEQPELFKALIKPYLNQI